MKKTSVISLLLFALVVSGCTSTPKKKKKTSSQTESSAISNSQATASSAEVISSSNVSSSQQINSSSVPGQSSQVQPSSNSQSQTPPVGESTIKIKTCGSKFVSANEVSEGMEFNSEYASQAQRIENLRKYFDSDAGWATSINCKNIFIQPLVTKEISTLALTIGTAKKSSSLTINSSLDIVKVVVQCRPYFNNYTSQGVEEWVHDKNSEIYINNEKTALENSNEITSSQNATFTPSSPVKQIVLSNGGDTLIPNRIFVEQIEITFKK